MNFVLIYVAIWSVFASGCHSSTDKNSQKNGITSDDSKCVFGHCSAVILSQDDYLFLPDETLFIRPLGRTIDGSSYVTSNGAVAVCECLFHGHETPQYGSCNLTIDGCSTVSLDSKDILHLSDGAVFVKSLNTRLNNSAYGVVNGSVVVCECLNQEHEFSNKTCNFSVGEKTSMSANCSTLTLRPRDYRFLPNATLHVLAWDVTLNDSFFSVENGSVNVCVPDCLTVEEGGANRPLQISCICVAVFIFHLFASCTYCAFPMVTTNRGKRKTATFLYTASGVLNLLNLVYIRAGYYDIFVVIYYMVFFLGVVEFGMLSIMSSDWILKCLELIGAFDRHATNWNVRSISPYKPMRLKCFYWCSLIIPFAVAGFFRSQEFSDHSHTNKISSADYYYSKRFEESLPLHFLCDVILVFATVNLTIFMVSFFWYWRRGSNPHDQQMLLRITYMMHMMFFTIAALLWITGYSILVADEMHSPLWPLFLVANFVVSVTFSLFVFRDNALHLIINYFVII